MILLFCTGELGAFFLTHDETSTSWPRRVTQHGRHARLPLDVAIPGSKGKGPCKVLIVVDHHLLAYEPRFPNMHAKQVFFLPNGKLRKSLNNISRRPYTYDF